jgi:DNA ligase-associated metallophosphoesterase
VSGVSASIAEGFSLGGEDFCAHVSGTLFHAGERLLIVADLHLEKGSAFAERRVLLPPYDTPATLSRLAEVVAYFAPRAILALGDSFHDVRAGARMGANDRESLQSLQSGREWIWIAGNHDPEAPAFVEGLRRGTYQVGAVTLRHEPSSHEPSSCEIAGHLHPVARVAAARGRLRRRCFLSDDARCVMPAFGAYAGGLNILDEAFTPLFTRARATAHVLGRANVYRIGLDSCRPD